MRGTSGAGRDHGELLIALFAGTPSLLDSILQLFKYDRFGHLVSATVDAIRAAIALSFWSCE
jgi:hypothetical protein